MDDRQALLAAVIANPDEDTPRLAFADWLQEHGDSHDRARAEFIRLQVEAGRLPELDTARVKLEQQAEKLELKHESSWLGPLGEFCSFADFERGLLADWHATAGDFLKKPHQQAACEWFPRVGVETLLLTEQSKRAKAIAASPALAWVTRFVWLRARIDDDGMKALAASPHASRISRFLVTNPGCSNDGLRAFAESECWPNLRSFGVRAGARADRFGYEGVERVLKSDRFPRLEELDLGGTWMVGPGKKRFFSHPEVSRLRVLNTDGGIDVGALAASPHPTRLEELGMHDATITDAEAMALADSPALANLKQLVLRGMNTYAPPLSPAARRRLEERFGDRLSLEYSPLCGR